MAGGEASGGGRKRISFLMPYIDFCFMLIIIFLGMLSIAYFEPLGTSDITNRAEPKIDRLEGENPVRPAGITVQLKGAGDEAGGGPVHPLISPASGAAAGARRAAPAQGDAGGEDAEKLKKQIEEQKKKLEELEQKLKEKEDKTGRGDHLYIDLGGE